MVERKIVKASYFHQIAQTNEYFIWHFLQKNQTQNRLSLFSYFDEVPTERKDFVIHTLKYLLDRIQIPYFESYTDESMDFLMGLGFDVNYLYKVPNSPTHKEFYFSPIFIGFNKFKIVGSSAEKCYCDETFLELVMKMNPDFIINSSFD